MSLGFVVLALFSKLFSSASTRIDARGAHDLRRGAERHFARASKVAEAAIKGGILRVAEASAGGAGCEAARGTKERRRERRRRCFAGARRSETGAAPPP